MKVWRQYRVHPVEEAYAIHHRRSTWTSVNRVCWKFSSNALVQQRSRDYFYIEVDWWQNDNIQILKPSDKPDSNPIPPKSVTIRPNQLSLRETFSNHWKDIKELTEENTFEDPILKKTNTDLEEPWDPILRKPTIRILEKTEKDPIPWKPTIQDPWENTKIQIPENRSDPILLKIPLPSENVIRVSPELPSDP